MQLFSDFFAGLWASGRTLYLVVVLVAVATRPKQPCGVCTTHSCATWRGLMGESGGGGVGRRGEGQIGLLSTTSHKLVHFRKVAQLQSQPKYTIYIYPINVAARYYLTFI